MNMCVSENRKLYVAVCSPVVSSLLYLPFWGVGKNCSFAACLHGHAVRLGFRLKRQNNKGFLKGRYEVKSCENEV